MNLFRKLTQRVSRYGWKRTLTVILQNKLYRPLEAVILRVMKKLTRSAPLTDTIVLESHNDFDSNGGAFYAYLIENRYNEHFRIVWLLRHKKPRKLPTNVRAYGLFRPSLGKAYALCTARYISSDHVIQEKVRPDQFSIYLTHGAVSLKAVKGLFHLPDGLDYYLCPSDFWAPVIAELFQQPYPNERQVILGYPCHDALYQPRTGEELAKITSDTFRKVILWMPTFRFSAEFDRNDSSVEQPLGIPLLEDMESYEQLNRMLARQEAFLIIKIHPMQDMSRVKIKSLSNITVLDAVSVKKYGVDNYRLMRDTDALISDYSSAAYDYLHLNRPIGYMFNDVDSYTLGLNVDDPSELLAGPIIYTKEDLLQFIADVLTGTDTYQKARKDLLDKLFRFHDGNSAARLAEFMGLTKPDAVRNLEKEPQAEASCAKGEEQS